MLSAKSTAIEPCQPEKTPCHVTVWVRIAWLPGITSAVNIPNETPFIFVAYGHFAEFAKRTLARMKPGWRKITKIAPHMRQSI
jgi:hypothetical protein